MSVISERLQQEQRILTDIRGTVNTFNCVLGEVTYASSPLTTGKRMYNLFEKHGVTTVEALKQVITPEGYVEQVLQANIREGIEFGNEIVRRGSACVIVPGVYFRNGWTQEHYMSLWNQVIVNFAKRIDFNDEYQYSTGCVTEFLIGLENGKVLAQRDGSVIDPKHEVARIALAIEDVDRIGVDVKPLFEPFREIDLFLSRPQRSYSHA